MDISKNTILVSSFPKSGATWFQFLIYSCYNGAFKSSKEVLRFYPPSNRTKLIEKSKADPLFIKSHVTYSKELPFVNKNSKCIVIVRHPLDVGLSLVNHHKNQGSLRLIIPYFKKKYLNSFLDENAKLDTASWSQHSKSWLEQKQFPLHIIRYDDLMRDPIDTLMQLRDNYDLKFNDGDISKAVEYCSIQNMKALETKELNEKIAGLFYSKRRKMTKRFLNSSFVNKGGSSDYNSEFNQKYLKEAAEVFNPLLVKLELKRIVT